MTSFASHAAEPLAPAKFQPNAETRPIWVDRDAAQQARTQGQVERLQWKPNHSATSPQNVAGQPRRPLVARPNATTKLVGWEDREAPAPRTNGVSPFDDPFGDRVAQNAQIQDPSAPNRGGNFQLQPVPNVQVPNVQVPNVQVPNGFQPAPIPGLNGLDAPPAIEGQPALPGNPQFPPLPTQPNFDLQDPTNPNPLDPPPTPPTNPLPNLPIEPPPSLPPMDLDPPAEPMPPTAVQPCEQIYNGRNCCKESERCKLITTFVADHSLANISLSVSPRFAPNETLEQEASELANRLANAPVRTWRNRRGDVLGRGRMTNFQNGKVVVTQDSGELVQVFYNELSDDDTCFVAAYWGLPSECVLSDASFVARSWQPSTFTWKATAACHKPLYFDQVQVERYGHSMGPIIQPIYSGAHFFTDVALLPYNMGIHPINECQYPLGYYRAGNCAPWLLPPVPISLRGALLEAGVWTGLPFIIP